MIMDCHTEYFHILRFVLLIDIRLFMEKCETKKKCKAITRSLMKKKNVFYLIYTRLILNAIRNYFYVMAYFQVFYTNKK